MARLLSGQIGGVTIRRLAPVVLTGVLLTACGGDAFSPEGVSGLYNLETVSGSPLPFSMTDDLTATMFTITAGSISLNANGTWGISTTGSATIEGTTTTLTTKRSGTFELVAPSTIRFTFPDEETGSGTLDGDRITIIGEGDSFEYRE